MNRRRPPNDFYDVKAASEQVDHDFEMYPQPPYLRIWFAEGASLRKYFWGKSWKRKLRLIKRSPGLVIMLFGSGLIKVITRTRLSHILIESNGIVLDPTFTGTKFYSSAAFQDNYPGERAHITIPISVSMVGITVPADCSTLAAVVWGTLFRLIKWLSMGRISLGHDCVSVAVEALYKAWLTPPRTITTPAQLRRWLEDNYDCTAKVIAGEC